MIRDEAREENREITRKVRGVTTQTRATELMRVETVCISGNKLFLCQCVLKGCTDINPTVFVGFSLSGGIIMLRGL